MENYVITIARGYGSGGKTIGMMLADDLGIKYYDKNLMRIASEESGIHERLFGLADERVKTGFFKKKGEYRHDPLPPESDAFVSDDNLFNIQAKIIRELAEKDEPCIIVGRCADYVLKHYKNVIRVFIYADEEHCIQNVVDMYGVSEKEALKTIEKTDKNRSAYYKYYTGQDWDNARNYELCLDSGDLGFQKCVDIIKSYIEIKQR